MSKSSAFRPGATALITGGASGVGFAFARLCGKHGMNVALVDIHSEHLVKAQDLFKRTHTGVTIQVYEVDVSVLSQWTRLKTNVECKFGGVDLLMLNAGVHLKPQQDKQSWEDADYFTNTFSTNLQGVVNEISTFLPLLQKSTSPNTIIITGPKQGITNPPGNPAYNASKAAVKSLAESLAHDLRTLSSPSHSLHTSVHLLIPDWTWTSLVHSSGSAEGRVEALFIGYMKSYYPRNNIS